MSNPTFPGMHVVNPGQKRGIDQVQEPAVHAPALGLGTETAAETAVRKWPTCDFAGCDKKAQGNKSVAGNLCVAHGGGRKCLEPGCTKHALCAQGKCAEHGGGKRCDMTREIFPVPFENHASDLKSYPYARAVQMRTVATKPQGSSTVAEDPAEYDQVPACVHPPPVGGHRTEHVLKIKK